VSQFANSPDASPRTDIRQIAHDLRGPLNTMRLSLDLLRRILSRHDACGDDFRRHQLLQIEQLERQIVIMTDVLASASASDRDPTT
jgi:signal transduction histidine kinase